MIWLSALRYVKFILLKGKLLFGVEEENSLLHKVSLEVIYCTEEYKRANMMHKPAKNGWPSLKQSIITKNNGTFDKLKLVTFNRHNCFFANLIKQYSVKNNNMQLAANNNVFIANRIDWINFTFRQRSQKRAAYFKCNLIEWALICNSMWK